MRNGILKCALAQYKARTTVHNCNCLLYDHIFNPFFLAICWQTEHDLDPNCCPARLIGLRQMVLHSLYFTIELIEVVMMIIASVTVSVNFLLALIIWILDDEAVHNHACGFRLLLTLAQNSGTGTKSRPRA